MIKYYLKSGKEIKYGETVEWEQEESNKNYKIITNCSVPFTNDNIPYLLEKGIVIQKEVTEKQKEATKKLSYEELVDTVKRLEKEVKMLTKQLQYKNTFNKLFIWDE